LAPRGGVKVRMALVAKTRVRPLPRLTPCTFCGGTGGDEQDYCQACGGEGVILEVPDGDDPYGRRLEATEEEVARRAAFVAVYRSLRAKGVPQERARLEAALEVWADEMDELPF